MHTTDVFPTNPIEVSIQRQHQHKIHIVNIMEELDERIQNIKHPMYALTFRCF